MAMALLYLLTLTIIITLAVALNLQEPERLKEYEARNYSWPLPHFVPDTPGWRRLMSRRFEQVEQIPKMEERYWAWVGAMASAVAVPNFTGEFLNCPFICKSKHV